MTDEYIRKQDAVDAFNRAVQDVGILDADDIETVFEMLSSADVVPVVRCKDCKHHTYDENFSCYWCEYPGRVRDTTPDGFCEKGEE